LAAASLKAKHVAEYRDERLATQTAGATVVKDLNSLSHVLDVAIKDWSLPLASNPVKLVRKPKQASGRERRLKADEETRLLEACRRSRCGHVLAPLVILALETGMRLGELLGLEWGRINLDRKIAYLPVTKNGEPRTVPLSGKAVDTLKLIPRNLKNQRVFWTWSRTDSVENSWKRAVLSAGIFNLRFHDLRHEATSRLFERGLSLPEVAAITGHKTWQMLRRYTHLRAEDLAIKRNSFFKPSIRFSNSLFLDFSSARQ
jgi:integrase